ncbi:hypothetical protein HOP50_15g74180 [Chloropicon primus]|uniref:Uncharacterized protein n=1 Tax=Chloropicon primus TaxID=1764295 RepID=A0A5B8MYY1_9CHLO|nr:hypothetical protein A3770_15p73930 [Chloropicon primus]UPR04085.1 hypothetical protein HOP50_15g74180 [Chloropicon primus]|eukprot:QDZ24875.1 hypothetical protein A3770_15p73930 [Chloropicon primus]
MALAAAAIKAHFKGGVVDSSGAEKAKKIFNESNAKAFGEVPQAEAPPKYTRVPSSRPPGASSRQSLDRQLAGVEAVMHMQQAAASKQSSSSSGGDGAMGMKEKQAVLNAMFNARNSIALAPPAEENEGEDDEGRSFSGDSDDSMSDVASERDGDGEENSSMLEQQQQQPEAMMMTTPAVEEVVEEEDLGIPSVPDQRILAIVNAFVVNASRLVNRVCVLAENQLADMDRGIHKLQVTLTLLEKKLKSVDGLEPGQAPAAAATEAQSSSGPMPMGGEDLQSNHPQGEDQRGPEDDGGAAQEVEAEDNSGKVKAGEHPVYGRFFRMLRMGVVELAVKQKMQAEGLDGSVIDLGPEALLDP